MLAATLRVLALLGVTLATLPAAAASFDEQGELHFDPNAVWTKSFEEPKKVDLIADSGSDAGVLLDAGALHGAHVLALVPFQGANVEVTLPTASGAYGARVWARGDLFASLELVIDGRVEDFGMFYPTGRMTSDGWYELAAHDVSIDVTRIDSVVVGVFSPSGGAVDAIELVPEGPLVLGAACTGASDKSSCGHGQICMWGRCRNFLSRVPPLPPAEYRMDLVDYLDQRFELLYGPFENRKLDLPNARVEIDGMRSAPDAWSFWRHFRVAIHRLHDWHTRGSDSSGFLVQNQRPIAVCFIEGKADLSAAIAPSTPGYLDVLVSHVGGVNNFGLQAGDRLLTVDGQHPIAWARSLIAVDFGYETASNHATHAEPVARLNRLIATFADRIEVLRCDKASAKCAAQPETISISNYTAAPMPQGSGVGCDNRPQLHVPGTPQSHPLGGLFSGVVKESSATEKIYGLQWSSLNAGGGGGGNIGVLLESAVAQWRADARGVILDHRTGFGGTTLGAAIIWNFLRPPTALDIFQYRQRADQVGPSSLAEGQKIFAELEAAGHVEIAGGTNPVTDVPVALLVHLDGSASDWLPLGVKGAPKAKVFGPFETAGAFSTLLSFGYWFGVGYSIAIGDTLHSSGQTLNGHGVVPDVIVIPLQSDLLAGKDTVYDAALAWVRQELKP